MKTYKPLLLVPLLAVAGCASTGTPSSMVPTHFEIKVGPDSGLADGFSSEGSIRIETALIYPHDMRQSLPSEVLVPGGWVSLQHVIVVDRMDPENYDLRSQQLGFKGVGKRSSSNTHEGTWIGVRYQSAAEGLYCFSIRYSHRSTCPDAQASKLFEDVQVREGDTVRIALPISVR